MWVQNDWQFVWKWELFKDILTDAFVQMVCTDLRTILGHTQLKQGVYG